ncbi:MAG: FecR family protein [Ekhidna sp.]
MQKELIEKYNQLRYNNDPSNDGDDFVDFLFKNSEGDAPDIDLDAAWNVNSQKINSTKHDNYAWLKVAAGIVIVLSVAFTAWKINASPDQQYISSTDQKLEVTFPDGSKGVLNQNSSFSFLNQFGEERRVAFEGEAYFDIEKSNKPFIIEVGGVEVKVLGTAFNLNSTETSVELYVERGLVAFVKDGIETKVAAGKEAVFIKENSSVNFSEIPQANVMSWRNGTFNFDKTPLSEALSQLEEFYDVSFKLSRQSIAKCQITATFDQISLKEVVKSIETLLEVKTSKVGNTIKISGQGC